MIRPVRVDLRRHRSVGPRRRGRTPPRRTAACRPPSRGGAGRARCPPSHRRRAGSRPGAIDREPRRVQHLEGGPLPAALPDPARARLQPRLVEQARARLRVVGGRMDVARVLRGADRERPREERRAVRLVETPGGLRAGPGHGERRAGPARSARIGLRQLKMIRTPRRRGDLHHAVLRVELRRALRAGTTWSRVM